MTTVRYGLQRQEVRGGVDVRIRARTCASWQPLISNNMSLQQARKEAEGMKKQHGYGS